MVWMWAARAERKDETCWDSLVNSLSNFFLSIALGDLVSTMSLNLLRVSKETCGGHCSFKLCMISLVFCFCSCSSLIV